MSVWNAAVSRLLENICFLFYAREMALGYLGIQPTMTRLLSYLDGALLSLKI